MFKRLLITLTAAAALSSCLLLEGGKSSQKDSPKEEEKSEETPAIVNSIKGKVSSFSCVESIDIPLKGAKVELMSGQGEKLAETESREDGSFLFDQIEPGSYALRLSESSHFSQEKQVELLYREESVVDSVLEQKCLVFAGVLKKPDISSPAGSSLSLFRGGELLETVVTDENGAFEFSPLVPNGELVNIDAVSSDGTLNLYLSYPSDLESFEEPLDLIFEDPTLGMPF